MRRSKLFISFLLSMVFLSYSFEGFSQGSEEEKFYIATKAFADNFYDASASLFERFVQEFPQSKKLTKPDCT